MHAPVTEAIASWAPPASASSPSGSGHRGRHINEQGVPDVVDIGFTWLAGSAQRSPVNTEAKLLMMGHAFEVWQVHRVALADRRPQCPVPRRHRAHRRPAGRHHAGGPAGLRRHGAHLGPVLHRGGRVAVGERAPDDPAAGRLRDAPGLIRPGRARRRSCGDGGRAPRPPLPPWGGSPPPPCRCGGSSRPTGRPARRNG